MTGGSLGQVRHLRYVGANGGSITIKSDVGGSAGNRFKTYGDVDFKFGGGTVDRSTLIVRHDGTYWRPLFNFSGATANTVTSFNVEDGIVTEVDTTPVAKVKASGRFTSQSAANSSVATYQYDQADASFRVWMNMRVASATVISTTMRVTYTDEGGTARNVIFPVEQLAGTLITAGAITGTGVWHSAIIPIRAKVSTPITLFVNTGTFTSVNYNVEGFIELVA